MKLKFDSLYDNGIYDTAKVLFILGSHNIFNNIAIDTLRSLSKPKEVMSMNTDLLSDFSDGFDSTEVEISNSVNFETFTKVNSIPCATGKWFCSVDYGFLSKKSRDWIKVYIKEPSDYGLLAVYSQDWRDYKELLNNRSIIDNTSVHALQLSFPNRSTLEKVVKELFIQRGLGIEQRAIELFIMRMSNSYDDYEEVIDKIAISIGHKSGYTVTYADTISAMKGIENFVLDDFFEKLLVPLKTDKQTGRNKIYKMLWSLMEEFSPIELVRKIRYKVDDYIAFRLAINAGDIPILVKFSVPEAKKKILNRLGEENRLCKFSDYTFRKMANIASMTSIKDWVYIKMMLDSVRYKYDSTSYERVLYSIVNRSVLNEFRLNNDIGIESVTDLEIKGLSGIAYTLGSETQLNHDKSMTKS